MRVVVLPPTRADGLAMAKLFTSHGIEFVIVPTVDELQGVLEAGAGSLILCEEVLAAEAAGLTARMAAQPIWSDLPLIVLSRGAGESAALGEIIGRLGSVSVVERPVRTSTLVSLIRSSHRARARQYQLRDHLIRQESAQRAIQEGERRYRALIENVADYAIFMTDEEGRISTWNSGAEAVLGYQEHEVRGRSIELIYLPEETGRDFQSELTAAREHGRVPLAGWKRRKSGDPLRVEGVIVATLDHGGRLLGYAFFLRDITEKHRIETEREALLASERAARSDAERSGRMKDEFLATLSHELRTPLNAIMGWTHVLRRSTNFPPEALKGLDVIERNARSQAQIIEDLLDMSSIVSGKARLEIREVDLASIVETALETLRPAMQAKGLHLVVHVDPHIATVRGDPNRLQQILWNLLTNAVKFSYADGTVTVTLRRVDSHLELTVSDEGQGIDAAFLPHVFDRFRQGDASSTRLHGGLGLGLAIVKQLAELHGGSITATSPGPGKGATFCLALPILAMELARGTWVKARRGQAVVAGTPVLAEGLHAKFSGLRVLVVDDEADARELVQRLLEEYDATVVTAGSAAEAMDAFVSETPDVIVSDIGLPGEDGYALIRKIRSIEKSAAKTPAIALTAYARSEDRARALGCGYQSHLAKPVEPAALLAAIEHVVARPRAHDA